MSGILTITLQLMLSPSTDDNCLIIIIVITKFIQEVILSQSSLKPLSNEIVEVPFTLGPEAGSSLYQTFRSIGQGPLTYKPDSLVQTKQGGR